MPAVLLPAVGVALLYHRGARRAGLAPARRWAFLTGLAIVVLALTPALEGLADTSFAWHMVQHQLLTLVAAPLLASGGALRAVLAARRRPGGAAHDPASPPPSGLRGWRVPGDPGVRVVLAAVMGLGVMLAWHLPPLFEAALADPRLHGLEHLSLLGSAVVLWTAIWRAAEESRYVLAAVLAAAVSAVGGAVLGVFLLGASELLYPWYAGQPGALTSQRVGGALMKVGALVVYVGVAVTLVVRWLARSAREPAGTGSSPVG
ncbi:cytochrome c oxidase assembly protein [Egicoccus sp. AB-alg2]|uniref:cytochrome c oxidase assembly protein n=1 Tax=Egicoccus sp. AB-alg2 TaxID=3242693 RepID=UPI00359DFFDA